MFFGTDTMIFHNARELRSRETDTEKL
jgi:hypothetical protein